MLEKQMGTTHAQGPDQRSVPVQYGPLGHPEEGGAVGHWVETPPLHPQGPEPSK